MLLPPHRERANNTMYYSMTENGQVGQDKYDTMPRAFLLLVFLETGVIWLCFDRPTTYSVPYFNK